MNSKNRIEKVNGLCDNKNKCTEMMKGEAE